MRDSSIPSCKRNRLKPTRLSLTKLQVKKGFSQEKPMASPIIKEMPKFDEKSPYYEFWNQIVNSTAKNSAKGQVFKNIINENYHDGIDHITDQVVRLLPHTSTSPNMSKNPMIKMTDIARLNNETSNKRNNPKFFYNKEPMVFDFEAGITKSHNFKMPTKTIQKGINTCISTVIERPEVVNQVKYVVPKLQNYKSFKSELKQQRNKA